MDVSSANRNLVLLRKDCIKPSPNGKSCDAMVNGYSRHMT